MGARSDGGPRLRRRLEEFAKRALSRLITLEKLLIDIQYWLVVLASHFLTFLRAAKAPLPIHGSLVFVLFAGAPLIGNEVWHGLGHLRGTQNRGDVLDLQIQVALPRQRLSQTDGGKELVIELTLVHLTCLQSAHHAALLQHGGWDVRV